MALQSLSHAMLLAPQNPFYVLQFAETAYTSNDVPLAAKMFLNVIDMCDTLDKDPSTNRVCLRAWWGISLVSRCLFRLRVHIFISKYTLVLP